MPVTFISRGYDTTPAKPYGEKAWAEAHGDSFIGAAKYGVNGAADWKVSIVASATRTVSISAGSGWGAGVTDTTDQNETLQFAPSASGSRWDTVAVRRDWTPTAGVSQFVVIPGGSPRAISGSRLYGPGTIDDQPIALVQIKENQTQPEAVVDLRCWAANGGVEARDVAALEYLSRIGARVKIGSTTWSYGFTDLNYTPSWISDAPEIKNIALSGGYAALGAGYASPLTRKHADGLVHLDGAIGAFGSGVNVDKARPNRFKVGEVTASHIPAGLQTFEPIATESMGKVFLYVYPVGHAKAGWVEFEASAAPGMITKAAFSILLTGGFSWAAAS